MKTPVTPLLLSLALLAGCVAGDPPTPSFDYVVVGAGAAGSVLAHRLTEDPGIRVLVLEAGGPDDDPRIKQPSAFRQLLSTPFNWGESTLPEPHLDGREVSLGFGSLIRYFFGEGAEGKMPAGAGLSPWFRPDELRHETN